MPPRRTKDAKSAGALTITAQESRFHTDIDEDNNLKEIVVKDLSISIGNRELLSHANFQLQRGRHYVLHGRNGIGKSTLLRAIATDQIPSIPRGIKVLLLGQTISGLEDDVENLDMNEMNVLDFVVRSDEQREILLREAEALGNAIENSADPTAGVWAYRQVSHERLGRKLEKIKQIAIRRSGGRGADAKKVLLKTEKEFEVSKERLEGEVGAEEMGEETQKAAELMVEIQTSLELMDASAAEAKARSVLIGLGFSEEAINQPRSQLSGGWRTRCSLACALCQSPDLLLLDEPTNFLDLPSIIWLERYVQDLTDTTVIVVTHDRSFGDSVAEELLVLRNQTLERFRGNLSSYEMDRLKTYKHMTRLKDAQDKQKKHIQSTIDGNVAAAKRAGDDKKLKQAASRKKKLDERMGLQVSAKGTRFKLNRDRAGYYADGLRNEIEVPTFDPPATMTIPAEPSDLRFPGSLVSFEKVGFSYGVGKNKKQILNDIDLTIQLGDRIGIAGLNGSGKSTLVSLAMGVVTGSGKPMMPTSGAVTRHTRAKFALYSQQAAEELETLATKRPELTALSHLMEFVGLEIPEQEARGLLAGVGLAGKIASDVPIALLSGGQRVRLALAKILSHPPHLLILDEVTTHLDTDTIQALVTGLKSYKGAILVVTHDRFFMRCVVEGESMRALAAASRPEDEESEEDGGSDEDDDGDEGAKRMRLVYRLSKGNLSVLKKGMEGYEEIAARTAAKMGKT
ncbi:related to positive effector protein GCN20 [Ramularia collo-cygni]|uniref:Related to positive effector protein GCN20 n=1 Tax=Ramularia collo-cygni TaxID=112498 RepID=A0A2D3UPC1_9PEZI|nr:related to positive effector protein GCN20 [Ramularia collo-cygni]CZT15698.1 related to positive effector protein GCN20 [Ramularia collo-cygni]